MVTIRQQGKWWQVRNGGYTIAQYTNRDEAEAFKSKCGRFPAESAGIGHQDLITKIA